MIASYISSAIYLLLFSGEKYYTIAASIIIVLFVIPIALNNLGFHKISLISFLISNELLMSLLFYVILRGFYDGIMSLNFYATNIPTVAFSSPPIQITIAIIELSNSFMFLVMMFPEIAYFSYKIRDSYPLILGVLALLGPNTFSEMTHAILPLRYDPFREASILSTILSISFTIFLTYNLLKGKIGINKYLIFIGINIFLSLSSLYYAITVNKILYGLATLIAVALCFIKFNKLNVNLTSPLYFSALLPISLVPQVLWAISVCGFFHIIYLSSQVAIGVSLPFIAAMYYLRKIMRIG